MYFYNSVLDSFVYVTDNEKKLDAWENPLGDWHLIFRLLTEFMTGLPEQTKHMR